MPRNLLILIFPLLMALLAACGGGSSGGDDDGGNGDSPDNTPPTITSIADQSTPEGSAVGPLSFTVADAETPAGDLSVTGSSSNTTLVPNGNISFGGSGADRTVTITPASGETGTATITLTVEDAGGLTASVAFLLTVTSGGGGGGDLTETYLIIDISGGPDAESYPVSESATVPADLNSDLYKTDRIVLRRIPAGTFMMGSPADELGRRSDREDLHEVTLTQDFYMAVFQVTQRQWLQVMGGSNPSLYTGDTRPVERVSWNAARGGTWAGPDGGDPGSATFMGRLAAKTGIAFDLPTEAQWEYAARAGTTTALNSGQNLTSTTGTCPNLNELGRYTGNRGSGQHAVVGSYTPNSWGLYDMHGNVREWCLDWYTASLGTSAVTDPVGPASGSSRVQRGGSWSLNARFCRSANRHNYSPGHAYDDLGFRPVSPGQPASNTPPTISSIADQSTIEDTVLGPLSFTVDDGETPAGDLTVTGSSSNATLVPNGNITFGGSGANRTVTITPASGETGTATITLTVEDGGGLTASVAFLLTVTSGGIVFIDGAYLIIDISGGPDATSYPIEEVDSVPADINSDLYKTDRIVLRRIPAGTFMMGSPAGELGRFSNEDLHEVTLTQDFYMAVFQVTQRQWLQVMGGSNPSLYTGDTRPVERVSWNAARGGTWAGPDGGDPGSATFMGRLAAKTGIAFDLPTEAQWEYAARAGTTTALNSGQNLTSTSGSCPNLNELGRYWNNGGSSGEHAVVGSYTPNSWGLYDMHGNVIEWCLDWYTGSLGTSAVTDPVGPASGSNRVERGGSWNNVAQDCRTAVRDWSSPGSAYGSLGFRPVSPGQPASPPEGDG